MISRLWMTVRVSRIRASDADEETLGSAQVCQPDIGQQVFCETLGSRQCLRVIGIAQQVCQTLGGLQVCQTLGSRCARHCAAGSACIGIAQLVCKTLAGLCSGWAAVAL